LIKFSDFSNCSHPHIRIAIFISHSVMLNIETFQIFKQRYFIQNNRFFKPAVLNWQVF
jgi:hypothetical protein